MTMRDENGRVKRGFSLNPKGRPKKRAQPKSLGQYAEEIMNYLVDITEGGQKKKVPAIKALFLGRLFAALNGNDKAYRDIERLITKHAPKIDLDRHGTPIDDLAEFNARIEAISKRLRSEGDTNQEDDSPNNPDKGIK